MLIASVDGLKGFLEAINSVFPNTEVRLCVVHQIRNSLKYVGSAYQKQFTGELKAVYQAFTKEEAEFKLDKLEEKWGKKYPIVFQSWRNKWDNLSVYFKYPEDIRRVIYTGVFNILCQHRVILKFYHNSKALSSRPSKWMAN